MRIIISPAKQMRVGTVFTFLYGTSGFHRPCCGPVGLDSEFFL